MSPLASALPLCYDCKLYLINKIIIYVAFAASLVCKRERFDKNQNTAFVRNVVSFYRVILQFHLSILILVIVSLNDNVRWFYTFMIIYIDKMNNEIKPASDVLAHISTGLNIIRYIFYYYYYKHL